MALRSLEREMSVYLLPSEIQCALVCFPQNILLMSTFQQWFIYLIFFNLH